MTRYGWARWGDVNAFFGLMLDNVAVMVLLVASLTSATLPFTPHFVMTRMIPGTALGVLMGDLIYTWMAFRLARRTGRSDVTAMPLGLDTPSTFGVAFLVLLPTLQQGQKKLGMDHETAMLYAWHVGVTVLILIGVFKVVFAPVGNAVRRWVPRAGLLGSLAAIALVLISFLPLLMEIGAMPVVGLLSLTVILITLVAHRALPWQIPGALAAVVVGVMAWLICLGLRWTFGWDLVPPIHLSGPKIAWAPPPLLPALAWDGWWWGQVVRAALEKLPVAIPFALATIVGGIDCTESAAAAGDEYDTRTVLLTEGVASVAAAFLGGVIQTTPYIGHPAYKAMGGRAAYTLATGLFVGIAGYFGWFTHLFEWLPQAAMFPILVFVGLEITAQSFRATPRHHYPALAFAMLPALAYLATIPLGMALGDRAPADARAAVVVQTLRCLANGFIVSGLLWAASLAALLDGQLRRSAVYLAVAGVCAFFGIIHSPLQAAPLDLPYRVLAAVPADAYEALRFQTPYHWTAAYALAAAVLFGLSFFPTTAEPPSAEPAPEHEPTAESAPGHKDVLDRIKKKDW